MTRTILLIVPLALACTRGKIRLGDLEEPEDIVEACEANEPETVTIDVVFPETTDACPWGEADNLPPDDGLFTARVGQHEQLELPEDGVICDMAFDFSGLVPGEVQVMVYDDHFFFTFNDIVLAASYGPAVDEFEAPDGMPVYSWADIRGLDYHADSAYDAYCLGDESGDSECDIPDTEVEGPISLSYSEDLVSRLGFLAIEAEQFEFGFVTTGDNNEDSDCMHEEFGFTIEVPYLPY